MDVLPIVSCCVGLVAILTGLGDTRETRGQVVATAAPLVSTGPIMVPTPALVDADAATLASHGLALTYSMFTVLSDAPRVVLTRRVLATELAPLGLIDIP